MSNTRAPTKRFFRLFHDLQYINVGCERRRNAVAQEALRTSSTVQKRHLPGIPVSTTYATPCPKLSHQRASYSTDTKSSGNDRQSASESRTQPLPEQMRGIMRCIPHPVVVISPAGRDATHASPEDSLAMTVSSFNTVCIYPTPVISFNTKVPSRTLAEINNRGGDFLVHFLAPSSKAAALTHEFAGRFGNHAASAAYSTGVEQRPKDLARAIRGMLRYGFDGLLARSRCRLIPEKTVEVGDHRILVAEVLDVEYGPGWDQHTHPFGLMYAGGRYWQFNQDESNMLGLDIDMPEEA